MSDGVILLIIFACVAGGVLFISAMLHLEEISEWAKYKVSQPFTIYKKNKQMNCHHTRRKKDGDYSYSRVEYRYRYEHCKLDKYLSGKSAEQFEKDFGSDIFDLR